MSVDKADVDTVGSTPRLGQLIKAVDLYSASQLRPMGWFGWVGLGPKNQRYGLMGAWLNMNILLICFENVHV